MTSPFETAEFYGGPLDGQRYERRSGQFPARLEMPLNGIVYGYIARMSRLGGVIYRYVGPIAIEVVS